MTLTPVQQGAYDAISSRLSDGFFSGVDEGDLNAIRSSLAGLGAADADAVIDAMGETGLLDKFAQEANQAEFMGMGQDGFSVDERRDLFTNLAGKLDGDSLARFSDAVSGAYGGNAGFDLVSEFAGAVASHASPAAKADYIAALSDSTKSDGITSTPFGGPTSSREVDAEAGAIGTVLGSMNGYYAQRAFQTLAADPEALKNVLATAIDENVTFTGASVTSSFDPARFEGIMRAAASTSDPDLKAQIFEAGAEPLRTVMDADAFPAISLNDDAVKTIGASLAGVINSDTTGVLRELAFNTATQDGKATGSYAHAMIESGQTETLADQMSKLQFGNGMNENAVERLDQVTMRGDQPFRENAGTLGYFVGSVYAGAAANSGDVKKQQEVITGFLDFVAGKIPIGSFSASDLTLGQDLVGAAVESALKDPGAEPAQRLERAALPQDGRGELAVGDPVTSAFDTTINRVLRAHTE